MNALRTSRLCILHIALMCLAFSGTPALAKRALTVVADEWPPFSGAALPGGGISLDVIAAVLTRAGYDVTTEILPWARIMDGAPKGEYDVVGSLFMDADIAEYMTFSEPFYETEVHFMRQAGSTADYTDLDSLRPYSIAVGEGFLYEEAFDRADFLDKVTVTTTLQGIQMVAFGRADLTLDSIEVLEHSLQLAGDGLDQQTEILPGILAIHGIHMATYSGLEDSDAIVADFNRVLAEMQADGSLGALLEKHRAP